MTIIRRVVYLNIVLNNTVDDIILLWIMVLNMFCCFFLLAFHYKVAVEFLIATALLFRVFV